MSVGFASKLRRFAFGFCVMCMAALLAWGSFSTSAVAASKKVLQFSKVTVKTSSFTGFFGGRYASIEIKGSITNNTGKPINADNLPSLVWNNGEVSVKMTQEKLLADETCNMTCEADISLSGNAAPEMEFSGPVDFAGLDDAEKQLAEQLQAIVDEFAAEDAAKEQARAEAAAIKEQARADLKACEGKTAAEAYEIASQTEYEPKFYDSFEVNVTESVKASDDSAACEAPVTKVSVSDGGWFSNACVTFTLDYIDPKAKAERDQVAADEAAKEQAKASLEECVGKTAAEAYEVASRSPYSADFFDSVEERVTDKVVEQGDSEAREALVTEVYVSDGFWFVDPYVNFTLDYIDPVAKAERDAKAAGEAAKKQAEADLESCVGKSAAEAVSAASKMGATFQLVDSKGNDFTEGVKKQWYQSALNKVKVVEIKEQRNGEVTITVDGPVAMTPEGNEELRDLLLLKDDFDPSIAVFADSYKGACIEFDGCFASVSGEGSGASAKYTILIEAMDYDPNKAIGPNFHVKDIKYSDMNWVGESPSAISEGQNVHVIVRLGTFKEKNGLYQVTPVEMSLR